MTTSHPAPPAPGAHGGDAARIARSLGVDVRSFLDLSASLNPVAPDVPALAAAKLDSLRRYPDPGDVSDLLAEAIGVAPDRLLLTNGGAEAIALLAQEIGGQVEEPEFSLHPRDGATANAPVWRSNPHNPTGLLAPPSAHADVWDEAFYPLATGRWTRADVHATAVVGSLTKLFACPGLRLGYIIAPPDLIARLEERQPHWSVGSLALALLPELLELADLVRWAHEIAALRRDLVALLEDHGVQPQPSDANYLLCAAPPGFRDELLAQRIVVRDCSSFGLPEAVRIAVPDAKGLQRLATALAELGRRR
jgi:histidinol-phosphate/aromatic aminotransferase/cobyric acid decarboxylase-like protein